MDTTRKASRATAAVTEATAQAALRRGPVRELDGDEEKVLRMRLGATLPRTAPLPRADAGADEELAIELAAWQIEAFMKWKAHLDEVRAAHARVAGPAAAPRPSRAKEKIARALRRLK